eukprot:Amastigsp_a348729_7.p4 type:complete len:136 gc:universal Amastigsp_a348729_7:610-203(-)
MIGTSPRRTFFVCSLPWSSSPSSVLMSSWWLNSTETRTRYVRSRTRAANGSTGSHTSPSFEFGRTIIVLPNENTYSLLSSTVSPGMYCRSGLTWNGGASWCTRGTVFEMKWSNESSCCRTRVFSLKNASMTAHDD